MNFVKYKGDYYVSTETNYMRRIDPQTLDTKDKVRCSKQNAYTAHCNVLWINYTHNYLFTQEFMDLFFCKELKIE